MKSKCDVIVRSWPNDYEKTLQAVQDNLTDAQICDVLGSTDHAAASKAILNYFTGKVKYTNILWSVGKDYSWVLLIIYYYQ